MKLRTIARMLWTLRDPYRPVLAQIVVTRRCNLSCGYCNEYDKVSTPVETALLKRYIDHLAGLGTGIITFTGGETLLHPDLDEIIAYVVSQHIVCTSITNGFLLSADWIEKMNRSGLELLQVSIDNLDPDETSQKSFNLLQKKLLLLKQHARFKININAVLGSVAPDQTRTLVKEIQSLGFFMTVNLLHDDGGLLNRGLLEQQDLETLFSEIQSHRRRSFTHRFGEGWEYEMIRTGRSDWKCRAGSRYLYVDENGIVSYCSQRRGEPGIPLLEYGRTETQRFFVERKGCEPQCTISCVRRASALDRFRFQEKAVIPPQPAPGCAAPCECATSSQP